MKNSRFNTKQGIPFILVGTKLDLRDDQDACKRLAERRQTPISFSEAQGLATDLEAYRYLECSALTQHGLKQVGGWMGGWMGAWACWSCA